MNEKDIKHNLLVDISMYNTKNKYVPSAYQRMIMAMIEEHLDVLNIGEKRLMEELGISWVLLSDSIELKRKLLPTDKITGTTWHSGGRAPSFRRDFVFEDQSGEVIAGGATVSTLFDNSTRRLCLDRKKIAVVDLLPEEPYLDSIERRMKIDSEWELLETRKVRPSMIDGVGHVNNTKYCDFIYDAMTESDIEKLGDIKRIDVWFNFELREGDVFEVYRSGVDSNTVAFTVKKPNEPRSSFDMKITYFND